MLVTIASQAALAIKHLQHVEADILTQKNLVRSLFDDLFANKGGMEESMYRRASFLGCDLTQLHVVVQMEISQVGTEHGREKIMSETERVALNRSIANQLGQRSWVSGIRRLSACCVSAKIFPFSMLWHGWTNLFNRYEANNRYTYQWVLGILAVV
jgi:hypothetical protein